MRAPDPSEPTSDTFPTYQVPKVSAMRGSAPLVQQDGATRADGAGPPVQAGVDPSAVGAFPSVIGSSCRTSLKKPDNSNIIKLQSVTVDCLLNPVTVPNKQRNGRTTATNNNSSKLDCKFGALHGLDIPNKKSENLEDTATTDKRLDVSRTDDASILNNDNNDDCGRPADGHYSLERLIELNKWTRRLERLGHALPPMRLCGGGESSLSTGTSGWGTPPSQQTNNNNGKCVKLL